MFTSILIANPGNSAYQGWCKGPTIRYLHLSEDLSRGDAYRALRGMSTLRTLLILFRFCLTEVYAHVHFTVCIKWLFGQLPFGHIYRGVRLVFTVTFSTMPHQPCAINTTAITLPLASVSLILSLTRALEREREREAVMWERGERENRRLKS